MMKRFYIGLITFLSATPIFAQTQMVVRQKSGGMKAIPITSISNITFGEERLKSIDLGLPSGTLWSNCNLGSTYPEEYGDFFAWGEPIQKASFTQQNYLYYSNGTYTAIGNNISSTSHDAATENLGGQWAIPTIQQLQELIDHCTWTWNSYNNIPGYTVTGTNGNCIFLPANGNYYDGTTHDNIGTCGFYWSANPGTQARNARFLGFKKGEYTIQENTRDLGFCIRPVTHQPEDQPLQLSVGNPTGISLQGIGVEFDPHFLTACLAKNDGAKTEDWDNVIVPRVKQMKPHNFRVWVMSQWFEPTNDNNDPYTIDWNALNFDTKEMRALCKELDLAQEINAEVTIVFWGASVGSWMAGGQTGNWLFVPKDYDEWAENCAILAKYLIDTRHYTCVKMLTPINEPNFYYGHFQYMTAANYSIICHKIADQLDRLGIKDKIALNLSDNIHDDINFLAKACENVKDVAGMFNSHCYRFGYENSNEEIGAWEKRNVDLAKAAGKQHFVGEFGSNRTMQSARQTDIDYYRRGILIDRLVLDFLNYGACGCSYWQLFDEWYSAYDSYASMQQLGMWRYIKDVYHSEPYYQKLKYDYQPRPQYYAYGLLTQHIRPGADIHPISINQGKMAATAFRNVDGKWVYVFANPDNTSYTVDLTNSFHSQNNKFSIFRYIADELPYDDKQLVPIGEVEAGNRLHYEIPATSVILLKEK